ncbi:MAG: serine hydrolase [Gemmatimonadaceae bacterium]
MIGLLAVTATLALPADSGRLRRLIEERIAAVPGATVAVVYRPVQDGAVVDVHGGEMFHAASTMKLAVLIELFRRVDEGVLTLDRAVLLVNRFHSVVDGSPYALLPGDDSDSLLYARVGDRVSLRELAGRMITRSSNLATNALVALLSPEGVTTTARALGAVTMEVRRGVEDGKAFERGIVNRTSARDLAALLVALEQGRAASAAGCVEMRRILLAQEHNSLIPAGLPPRTPVAHKTGSITATLHDAALVYPLGGSPYVLVVLTRGVADQTVAERLIGDISRMVYENR